MTEMEGATMSVTERGSGAVVRAGLSGLGATVAGVIVAVLITGCGLGGGSDGGGGNPGGGQAQGEGQGGGGEVQQQPSAVPSAPDILNARAIATGTLTRDGEQLKVELVRLQRTSERMVRLDLRATAETELTSILTYYFGTGDTVGAADGITLVDGDAAKKYLVVHDSEGACLCTSGRSALSQGEVEALFAYFPAPPATTKAVDVVIPTMVPFDDVPITG